MTLSSLQKKAGPCRDIEQWDRLYKTELTRRPQHSWEPMFLLLPSSGALAPKKMREACKDKLLKLMYRGSGVLANPTFILDEGHVKNRPEKQKNKKKKEKEGEEDTK